jgi:hypothetical protein
VTCDLLVRGRPHAAIEDIVRNLPGGGVVSGGIVRDDDRKPIFSLSRTYVCWLTCRRAVQPLPHFYIKRAALIQLLVAFKPETVFLTILRYSKLGFEYGDLADVVRQLTGER